MAFKTSEKYKSVIYSGDCRHKLKLLFNGVELADADVYCESLKVTSRIIPNGSTRFSLDNFVAKEAEIILHDIDTTIIQSPVNISIGTLVDGTYEYVPIGLFVVQDLPTTDSNKTTIKLRDYAVKFDFGYNAKDIIDENGGSVTKLQILQDICSKAGVETDITKFYGSNSKIGIYDNSITARTYISYLAEQAGAIATIDRSGKLIFVQLKDLETVEIPLNIVEKYEDGEKYEISRVVYEDAIRKFEYGDESKDTLFINTANPYITNDVLTGTLSGSKIETSDSADAEVVNYKQYGITKQNVYSGNQLYDFENTSSITNGVTVDADGWITISYDNTNETRIKYFNYFTPPSNDIKVNTKYAIITEVKEVSGTGSLRPCGTQTNQPAQFSPMTLLNFATTSSGVYKSILTSVSEDVTPVNMLRTFAFFNVGQSGSITFRLSVIEDTSITTDSFKYEPYVGGKPSPSPDYPQEIEVGRGKNLFNINTATLNSALQWADGTYLTENLSVASDFIKIEKGKSYISKYKMQIILFNENKEYIGYYNNKMSQYNDFTISTDSECNYVKVAFRSIANNNVDFTTIGDIQLEKGSKATSYLPSNTIEIKSTGKNLYVSSSDIPTGYYSSGVKDIENTHDGDISIKTANAWAGVYFNLKELIANNNLKIGDKVTCSIYFKTNFVPTLNLTFTLYRATIAGNSGRITIPYNEVVVGEWKRVSFEFEINEYSLTSERARIETDYYDRDDPYYFGNNRTNYMWFASPQFEVGELTDYEPYKESSVTYDLGDNFLADKDYIENGVLNKHIGKVVLNGSESGWKPFVDARGHYNYYINNPLIAKNVDKCWCNQFVFQTVNTNNAGEFSIGGRNPNKNGNIVFNPSDDTTNKLSDFLSKIASNPLEVYFPLETPTQEQLTSTGELRTFEPNTIITNSLDSEMEVEYARNQTQVSQILQLNKNIPINSFKTGKILGNPAIDAYDIIKIVDGNKEFKTLATNDLTYNGVMINTFDTQIGKEAKKENVTLTPEATFKKWAKTEIDNVEAEVRINTGNIQTVKDEMGNMYTKGQVNELVANAETGVTNTFSEAGGNNEIRNSGLWFKNTGQDAETNPYEFWKGKANEGNNDKATNYRSILLGKGSFIQDDIVVPNGNYSISFYYRKLITSAIASVVINGKEYPLDSLETKQFYTGEQDSETGEYIVDPIVVSNNHIKIEFKCDVLDGVEVYDLMCNKGTVKLAYSQNQNETTTDTVNISKGITITSSVDKNTKFKAGYDGIRVLDGNNNPKTTFTDKGTETDELIVRKKATITGLLHQEVDDQTWVTKI